MLIFKKTLIMRWYDLKRDKYCWFGRNSTTLYNIIIMYTPLARIQGPDGVYTVSYLSVLNHTRYI